MAVAKAVQVYEIDGRLVKQLPPSKTITAFELDGRLYRTANEALRVKTMQRLVELLQVDTVGGPRAFASPHLLLANARAVAEILTAYADGIGV